METPRVGAGGSELRVREAGGRRGGGRGAGAGRPPGASGSVRLGLGVGDASRAPCHRLLSVTNSGPRGTQRLRPRETGEEEVGAGRGKRRSRERGPGRPSFHFRTAPRAARRVRGGG